MNSRVFIPTCNEGDVDALTLNAYYSGEACVGGKRTCTDCYLLGGSDCHAASFFYSLLALDDRRECSSFARCRLTRGAMLRSSFARCRPTLRAVLRMRVVSECGIGTARTCGLRDDRTLAVGIFL